MMDRVPCSFGPLDASMSLRVVQVKRDLSVVDALHCGRFLLDPRSVASVSNTEFRSAEDTV